MPDISMPPSAETREKPDTTNRRAHIKPLPVSQGLTTLGRRLFPEDAGTSLLLDLPVEIILLIAKNLPLYGRRIFSETCRALYNAIPRDKGQWLCAKVSDRLDYLTSLVREQPDRWVCLRCRRTHRDEVTDSPGSPGGAVQYDCSDMTFYRVTLPHLDLRRRTPGNSIYIANWHIQISVKFARLQKLGQLDRQQQERLKELLEPIPAGGTTCKITMYPKVVNGRYLMLVESGTLVSDKNEVDTRRTQEMFCQHLRLLTTHEYFTRDFEEDENPDGQVVTQVGLLQAACMNRQTAFDAFCRRCRLDVTLAATNGRLTVRTWRDLGSELRPIPLHGITEWWQMGAFVGSDRDPWERGSLRRAYESA